MMNIKKLQDIANILRRDSLKMTTAAGSGHPTSCLSCAEIMACLFFEEMEFDNQNPYNPDNDEFILSKGHAAPILYSSLYHAGCINYDLLSLRKFKSPLEGHPMPHSLKWIKVATGSLGQGLSVGVGMALASKLQKRKFRVYVLLGDSEMAEGSVYESLQFASFNKLDNLTAIVDVNRLGQTGETMFGHDMKNFKKIFEGFGFNLIVIDGHNIEQILSEFSKARNGKKPSLILAKTFKGKGVSFIEDKNGWHGKALDEKQLEKALKEIDNNKIPEITIKKPKKLIRNFKYNKPRNNNYQIGEEIATREAYGNALSSLAQSDRRVLVIDAETGNSTFSEKVREKVPSQFVEAFIAEQNMIGVSLGLSKKGFDVFPSTFSAFLSRAHDQIRMANLSHANMTICGSHAGVSIGEDGPSQMGLEDISIFRCLLDSKVFYPSDAVSTEKIVNLCSRLNGIKYMRTTRARTLVLYKNDEKFELGKFKVLKKSGKDKVVLIGSGITLHESLKAYHELKKRNINASVIDLYCIKPFDYKSFISFAKEHGNKIIVSEDHYPEGGIGEMLKSGLIGTGIKIKHLAVHKLPHSGTKDELLNYERIDADAITKNAMDIVKIN